MSILPFLQTKYKLKTAQSYYKEWLLFERFVQSKKLVINAIQHQHLLDYVNELKDKNLSPSSINRKLVVLEQVYEFLPLPKINPVKGLRLKKDLVKALPQPLNYQSLNHCLSDFPTKTLHQKQLKLILSLIHFQALRSAEIQSLKLHHLKLKRGLLEIPSVLRSNTRELVLTGLQIIGFQDFILKIRPQLPNSKNVNSLFISSSGSGKINNTLGKLKERLKKILPHLENLEHWRTSIIIHWLQHQSLLQVQSKLGHRYTSSTERYIIHKIKDLEKDLLQHHPLK